MRPIFERAIACAAFCLSAGATETAAQSPPQTPPPQQALPSIAPGENRVMSIQDLSESAKPFFTHQQERFLKRSEKTKGGLSYRVVDTSEPAVRLLDRLAERAEQSVDPKRFSTEVVRVPGEILGTSERIGVIAERGSGEAITRISRLFRSQDGKIVMISEWDYLADGGGVLQFGEYVNGTVRGVPAVLTVKRAGANALWNISWTTASKDFGVYVYEPEFNAETAEFVHRLADTLSD